MIVNWIYSMSVRRFQCSSRVLRWSTITFILLLAYYLYKTPKSKSTKQKSIIDTFVFRENTPKTSIQNDKLDYTTSLQLNKDDNIEFMQIYPTNLQTSPRPLPHPRSHVVTNSNHVISQFVSQFGCKLNKKHGLVYQYLKVILVCYELKHNTSDLNCRRWTWDPANWTLFLSSNQESDNIFNQYQICTYPKLTDRVAKLVYENGTVDYPGCSFNKSPCAVVEPYFDVTLNMRINWSPCCRKMMTTMLSNAHDIFEKHRIRYVMTGGAVISVGRENGTLIPYDTDLDLIIDIRDREKFANQSAQDMGALGYHYLWNKRGNYIKICQNAICDAHIDVWFFERYPGDRHMVKYFKLRFWSLREGTLFPTSWQWFEGKRYRFPRKIYKYLDHEYSMGIMAGYRNWKTVLLCNHKRGRKCTFYSDKKN